MNKAPQAFTDSLSNSNSSPIVTTATPPTQLPHFHSLAPFEFTACFQHLPNHYLRPLLLHLKPTFLPPLHHSNTSTTLGLLDRSLLPSAFCFLTLYFYTFCYTQSSVHRHTNQHRPHHRTTPSTPRSPLWQRHFDTVDHLSKIFYSGLHQVQILTDLRLPLDRHNLPLQLLHHRRPQIFVRSFDTSLDFTLATKYSAITASHKISDFFVLYTFHKLDSVSSADFAHTTQQSTDLCSPAIYLIIITNFEIFIFGMYFEIFWLRIFFRLLAHMFAAFCQDVRADLQQRDIHHGPHFTISTRSRAFR